MSPARRPQSRSRRRGSAGGGASGGAGGGGGPVKPVDLWRAVPPPPELAPITPTADPTALLDSLGSPPLQNQATSGQHYFASVIDRAATIANALAASAGLLAEPPDA